MNRRNLLRGAMTIPLASAISACKREREPEPEPSKPSQGALKIILNGPFGVVLHSTQDYRITAYVPSDPQREHEFRFSGPSQVAGRESKDDRSPTYSFELLHDGLEVGRGRPRIDQGFYDFDFPHIGEWKLPDHPFVAIELPRPDFITFTPPAQPVFLDGTITVQPLDHILEYRMSEPERVRFKSGEKEQRPMPCSELLKQYEQYGSGEGKALSGSERSQLRNMLEMLRSCGPSDLCLLFGVGLSPRQMGPDVEKHGIIFFNEVLLPTLFPGFPRRLHRISSSDCKPVGEDMMSSPAVVPAVWRYNTSGARLLQVASVLDCHYGGSIGTTP